jgi:hypothetical protein
MALADIFNPTFFLILGIVMLLLGLLVIYFETKLRDQNHKISSMVSLVSAIAEEIRGRKPNSFPMQTPNSFPIENINSLFSMNSMMNSSLIPVSDNEDEDEDDEEDDEDDETDNNDDEDDDGDDDDYEHQDDNSEKTRFTTPNEIINIGEHEEKINIFNSEYDDENDLEEMDELNDLVNELEETNFDTDVINIKEDGNNFDFLKTIHIDNLEEDIDTDKLDYKKFSLNKLRNIVVEKGLVTDSSKLKKHDLFKLLGVE